MSIEDPNLREIFPTLYDVEANDDERTGYGKNMG
jgi:hypothetical protein